MRSKTARSHSTTSVASSSSSASASSSPSSAHRSADELITQIVAENPTTFHLWSAGNLRVNGRNISVDAIEAVNLAEALRSDRRFEVTQRRLLDGEGGEWKASYRVRTSLA